LGQRGRKWLNGSNVTTQPMEIGEEGRSPTTDKTIAILPSTLIDQGATLASLQLQSQSVSNIIKSQVINSLYGQCTSHHGTMLGWRPIPIHIMFDLG